MAAQDTSQRKPAAPQNTKTQNGLRCVLRASGTIAACWRQYGRNNQLIKANGQNQQPAQELGQRRSLKLWPDAEATAQAPGTHRANLCPPGDSSSPPPRIDTLENSCKMSERTPAKAALRGYGIQHCQPCAIRKSQPSGGGAPRQRQTAKNARCGTSSRTHKWPKNPGGCAHAGKGESQAQRLGGQTLAPLGAATADNRSAAGGGHALQESMPAGPAYFTGLVCSFHQLLH